MRQSELHQYDSLGRLTSSHYSSSVSGTTGRFDESVSYNSNGSITSLLRNELSVKNEGMMEWLNAGRKMGSAGTDHFPE